MTSGNAWWYLTYPQRKCEGGESIGFFYDLNYKETTQIYTNNKDLNLNCWIIKIITLSTFAYLCLIILEYVNILKPIVTSYSSIIESSIIVQDLFSIFSRNLHTFHAWWLNDHLIRGNCSKVVIRSLKLFNYLNFLTCSNIIFNAYKILFRILQFSSITIFISYTCRNIYIYMYME